MVWLCGCVDSGMPMAQYYVVQPQDTLYSIAWRHSLDYRDLAAWNRLGPNYRIEVGQRLSLRAGTVAPNAPSYRGMPRGREPMSPAPKGSADELRENAALHWLWPTDRIGRPRRLPNGGLLIAGRLGQDVRAAAAGRVVYTGSGIRGFGKLVIIKHSATLLSAYAYNSDMLVRDGEPVAAGQTIAKMGENVRREPTLYFEIRLNGRSVDPVPYLPGNK